MQQFFIDCMILITAPLIFDIVVEGMATPTKILFAVWFEKRVHGQLYIPNFVTCENKKDITFFT